MATKTKRLSFDFHFYTPQFPEQYLVAKILDTYFVDINNLADDLHLYKCDIRLIEFGQYKSWNIQPLTLSRMKNYIESDVTKEYCDLLDISHGWFMQLIDNYLKYKLQISIEEI